MAEIPLRARDGSVKAWALIDAADAAWLNQWRWSMFPNGYVYRGARRDGEQMCFYLHREILGLSAGDSRFGDHINGNPLDNRRANLRIVPRAANAQNMHRRGGTSAYRGVSWVAKRQKWTAQGYAHGRQHNLGYYDDELEAARIAAEWRAKNMPYAVERAVA
jgi:hypothetical protein